MFVAWWFKKTTAGSGLLSNETTWATSFILPGPINNTEPRTTGLPHFCRFSAMKNNKRYFSGVVGCERVLFCGWPGFGFEPKRATGFRLGAYWLFYERNFQTFFGGHNLTGGVPLFLPGGLRHEKLAQPWRNPLMVWLIWVTIEFLIFPLIFLRLSRKRSLEVEPNNHWRQWRIFQENTVSQIEPLLHESWYIARTYFYPIRGSTERAKSPPGHQIHFPPV